MKDKLISVLETFGFPVYLNGTLNDEDDHPDSYFTFWNYQTENDRFYNNVCIRTVWGFWVYFYSTDPEAVNTIPLRAAEKLRAEGWIVEDHGEDTRTKETTHTGRILSCRFIENH